MIFIGGRFGSLASIGFYTVFREDKWHILEDHKGCLLGGLKVSELKVFFSLKVSGLHHFKAMYHVRFDMPWRSFLEVIACLKSLIAHQRP